MLILESYTTPNHYDCLECGQKTSVIEQDGYGTCQTPGCLHHSLIQFVYYPSWKEPKISRIGRELIFYS
jgi:hypothetical protein